MTAMTMERAAAWWAGRTHTPRPHRQTLIRWATRGVQGTRLRAERRGYRWFVTEDALVEFHRRMNDAASTAPRLADAARVAEIQENHARLKNKIAGRRGSLPR